MALFLTNMAAHNGHLGLVQIKGFKVSFSDLLRMCTFVKGAIEENKQHSWLLSSPPSVSHMSGTV